MCLINKLSAIFCLYFNDDLLFPSILTTFLYKINLLLEYDTEIYLNLKINWQSSPLSRLSPHYTTKDPSLLSNNHLNDNESHRAHQKEEWFV